MTEKKLLPLLAPKNYCDGTTDWCLDVRFTARCDSACSFCIAAEDMKNDRGFDPEAMLASVKATTQVSGLSIIGGEPLLFLQKLLSFMEEVEREAPHIENIYVTTALPYTVKVQRSLFEQVMAKTAVLNVSLQHYLNDVNNEILRSKKMFNRIELLEDILKNEEYRSKIRVHLNLSYGGIDTVEQLNEALYRLREMGVQDVKLNELMNSPEEYVSFEEMTGMKLDSPYAHGCSTEIDYFPGITTTLKRSCFVVEPSLPASKEDLLKVMWKKEMGYLEKDPTVPRVLYEDGSLTSRWQGEPMQ